MKVLLINPEFPLSFWTLQQSCQISGRKVVSPPLGLITVAALLPREWELRLKDLNATALSEEDWNWADVVMVSGMFLQRNGILALIREAKERGKTVVVGGPYATSVPDDVLNAGCDFLVRGEAENIVPFLVATLKQGKAREIFENIEKPEMSASPIPRFDLLNFDDYLSLTIQTSRGCPFECEFCDVVNIYGRKPRYKTPDQVTKELKTIYDLGWREAVFVSDDNFIGNKSHARAILHKLIPWMESHGKPFDFWSQVSMNLGHDLDMIDLMTEANFSSVFLGIESPDEDVLVLTRKYQNIRNPLAESLNNICKNGLSIVGSFIIGFDGEKRGAGERICALVDQTHIPMVMINILQAGPNTGLWDRLKKEGRLLQGRVSGEATFSTPNFIPTRPEQNIMEEYVKAWDYLYKPSRFLERTYFYYLNMRPTRRAMAKMRGESLPEALPRAKLPLRIRFWAFLAFFRLIWWQGIRPAYRLQFWRQLTGIHRKNPSRMLRYLMTCVLGENMFRLRDEVRKRAACALTRKNLNLD